MVIKTHTVHLYHTDRMKEILQELEDSPNKSQYVRSKIHAFILNPTKEIKSKVYTFGLDEESEEIVSHHRDYGFRNESDFIQYILEKFK